MLPELLEEILLHKRRGDTDIARDYNNTRLWQEANKQKNSESNSILCCETSLLSNTGKAAASLSVCDVVWLLLLRVLRRFEIENARQVRRGAVSFPLTPRFFFFSFPSCVFQSRRLQACENKQKQKNKTKELLRSPSFFPRRLPRRRRRQLSRAPRQKKVVETPKKYKNE